MSSHETIRVLEVGVDAQLPAEDEGKGLEGVAAVSSQSGGPAEASNPGPDNPDPSAEAAGMRPLPLSGITTPESILWFSGEAACVPGAQVAFCLPTHWAAYGHSLLLAGICSCSWSFSSSCSHFQA